MYHFGHHVGKFAGGLFRNAEKSAVGGPLLGILLAAGTLAGHGPPA